MLSNSFKCLRQHSIKKTFGVTSPICHSDMLFGHEHPQSTEMSMEHVYSPMVDTTRFFLTLFLDEGDPMCLRTMIVFTLIIKKRR